MMDTSVFAAVDIKGQHEDQIDIKVVNEDYHLVATESSHEHAEKDPRSNLDQLLALPQNPGIGRIASRNLRRHSTNIHDLLSAEDEHWDETQTLSVNHSTAPLTAKVVDIFEDCDSILSEEDRNMKPWKRFVIWLSHRFLVVLLVAASFLITVTLFFLQKRSNLNSPSGDEPWVWSAIPGIIAAAILVSYFVEITFLKVSSVAITNPLWLFPLIRKSSSGYIQVILTAILIQTIVLNWWLNTPRFHGPHVFYANAILVSAYVVGILLVVRNMFNELFDMWATEKSFGKRIEAMVFLENILLKLCCRTSTDKTQLRQILLQRSNRNYLMSYVHSIRKDPLLFPLYHQNGEWHFSVDSSIEVSTTKEMGLIADIIFSNILEDSNQADAQTIDLPTFVSYFDIPFLGAQSFRLMFLRQGNALQSRKVNRDQFISAFKSILNTRSVLANRLQSFANLSYLMNTCISTIFWVLMIIIICNIFGYELNQLVTAISALVLGISFALSKTISRAVESVVFVFGTKPYQVNDSVSINGNWYQVYQIGLLETKCKDSVNKLVRFSNLALADMPIVNFTNSFGCVTRIATQIRLDTSVHALESLKASILKYTVNNPEHWKPRVTLFLNDLSLTSAVEIEIRVESVYSYVDGGSFRVADTDLKNHIRKKMTKLGIEYIEPAFSVKLSSLPEMTSFGALKSRETDSTWKKPVPIAHNPAAVAAAKPITKKQ